MNYRGYMDLSGPASQQSYKVSSMTETTDETFPSGEGRLTMVEEVR